MSEIKFYLSIYLSIYITTGSWKGRGNQYIQFVRVQGPISQRDLSPDLGLNLRLWS